jgi:hypothetical protein
MNNPYIFVIAVVATAMICTSTMVAIDRASNNPDCSRIQWEAYQACMGEFDPHNSGAHHLQCLTVAYNTARVCQPGGVK